MLKGLFTLEHTGAEQSFIFFFFFQCMLSEAYQHFMQRYSLELGGNC